MAKKNCFDWCQSAQTYEVLAVGVLEWRWVLVLEVVWKQNSRSAPVVERVSASLGEKTIGCVVALYSNFAMMMLLALMLVGEIAPEQVCLPEHKRPVALAFVMNVANLPVLPERSIPVDSY